MKKTMTYSIKFPGSEVSHTITCEFDLSQLTPEDILQYAMQTIVIQKQARDRKCENLGKVPTTCVVGKPGTRAVSEALFNIVDALLKLGVPAAVAQNLAKLRTKDETPDTFIARLDVMMKGLGNDLNLVQKWNLLKAQEAEAELEAGEN